MEKLIYGFIMLLTLIACKGKVAVKHEKPKEVAKSSYTTECDSIQQNTIVSLSFLDFKLGEDITQAIQTGKNNKTINSVRIEDIQRLSTYTFNAKMQIEQKAQIVEITIKTINHIIGSIDVKLLEDIYKSKIYPLFELKYGKCNFGEWKFKNQKLNLIYENTQRTLYHPGLKKTIYLDVFDFKYIQFQYIDYAINNEIEIFEANIKALKTKAKAKQDSLKKLQEKEEFDRKEKIELKMKIKEANQI